MALAQIITYAEQIEKQRLGYQAASLTNFDNNNAPEIAAGSKVEIGGALFEAPGNEAIADWAGIANSSDVYIRLTVVGAAATAGFTIVAPVWSTSKQGWYDAGETMRYIGGLYKDAGGNYYNKYLMGRQAGFVSGLGFKKNLLADIFMREKTIEIGNWNMDLTSDVLVPHGLPDKEKIRHISVMIRNDTLSQVLPLSTFWDLADPNLLAGGIRYITNTDIYMLRRTGGIFDSVDFDATPFNRGWIYIKYRA